MWTSSKAPEKHPALLLTQEPARNLSLGSLCPGRLPFLLFTRAQHLDELKGPAAGSGKQKQPSPFHRHSVRETEKDTILTALSLFVVRKR
jgi:hypothetical protein